MSKQDHNRHLNPTRHLDKFDLEAEREGASIRRASTLRPVVKRKPSRGSCRQSRHAA